MAHSLPPVAIAQVVTRNLVPLAGILLLGWSAPNILILYFVDTLLSMGVMFAGLLRHFIPPHEGEGWAARVNAEVGYVGAGSFLAAVIGIPLGVPLVFMLGEVAEGWRDLVDDPAFRAGLLMQAIAASWSGRALYRALRTQTPEALQLKRRFALVFLRWIALVMLAMLGVGLLFGRFAAHFFVAIYTAATIFSELAPDQFLRVMPGGTDDAAAAGARPLPVQRSARRRRKR